MVDLRSHNRYVKVLASDPTPDAEGPWICSIVGCDEAVASGAPLDLCLEHLIRSHYWVSEKGSYQLLAAHLGVNAPEHEPSIALPNPRAPKPPTVDCAPALMVDESVVYYVRFADRIKIGTTFNLARRMTGVPHDTVLATEPGGRELEQARHAEFAQHRISRRMEWFNSGADLLAHIQVLQTQYGIPPSNL